MIYVVFTAEGLDRALGLMEPMDELRLNPGLVDDAELEALGERHAEVSELPTVVNSRHDAEIVAVVEAIEREQPQAEVMVEYS